MATPANTALTMEELLAELDQTVAKPIRGDIEWYEEHVSVQRGLTQAGAAFIIIAAGSIPLLSLLGIQDAGLIASLLGVAIAVVSGLAAHFRWQENWLGFLDAQRGLRGLLTQWELAMLEAKPAKARTLRSRHPSGSPTRRIPSCGARRAHSSARGPFHPRNDQGLSRASGSSGPKAKAVRCQSA